MAEMYIRTVWNITSNIKETSPGAGVKPPRKGYGIMRRTSKNRYYNPNPLKKETSDCVVRALCALTSEPWDDVYKELCEIGFEIKEMPNSKNSYETYLKKHGYTRFPISNKKGTKRPTVNDMAKRSKDGMNYLCDIANHLVTVSEGYILDLWDSGEKCLYAYWTKAE